MNIIKMCLGSVTKPIITPAIKHNNHDLGMLIISEDGDCTLIYIFLE